MKALVIGGGIGGLAAAIALDQAGLEVTVCERAQELQEAGAALVLWPNAVKALASLGVADAVLRSATTERRSEIRDWRGALLNGFAVADVERRFGAPPIFVHRSDLQTALRRALGPARLELGKVCLRVETHGAPAATHTTHGAPATAHFADGSTLTADLLVGADGFHSVARQLLDRRPPRYAGFTAWRGLVTGAGALLEPGVGFEAWGVGSRFGTFHTNRGDLFWFATMTAPSGGDSPRGRKADVAGRFAGWLEPVPAIIDATPPEAILRHDQYDRLPLAQMVIGSVALLGDAAHPMTPQLGQGACQALEDAVELGRCVAERADVRGALQAYEQRRLDRTRRIAAAAWRLGRLQQVASPLLARVRNEAVRLMPGSFLLDRLRWILGYHP